MIDDGLKWLFRSFSWSRGIVAAIVILAVLESVFGWDRVSFLEFTHVIITHWNVVTGHVFSWLTQWFPIPAPAAYARNLTVLGLVAFGPSIAFLISEVPGNAKVMRFAVILGIIGYCGWVVTFWSSEMAVPSEADLIVKVMMVLFLVTYPLGFSIGAILGLTHTEFGRAQSKAMIAMFAFIATLEVLYHFPKVEEAASTYVSYVNSMSGERDETQ